MMDKSLGSRLALGHFHTCAILFLEFQGTVGLLEWRLECSDSLALASILITANISLCEGLVRPSVIHSFITTFNHEKTMAFASHASMCGCIYVKLQFFGRKGDVSDTSSSEFGLITRYQSNPTSSPSQPSHTQRKPSKTPVTALTPSPSISFSPSPVLPSSATSPSAPPISPQDTPPPRP